jgi:hypothetical protein
MILGVIARFGFYLVPGLFGIRSYRRWKRGEIRPPLGWMFWGGFWASSSVFPVLIVAVIGSDLGM